MKPEVKPKVAAVPGNASPATLKKTCDTCRKRKTKCVVTKNQTGNEPFTCDSCSRLKHSCTYNYVHKQGGRPLGSRDKAFRKRTHIQRGNSCSNPRIDEGKADIHRPILLDSAESVPPERIGNPTDEPFATFGLGDVVTNLPADLGATHEIAQGTSMCYNCGPMPASSFTGSLTIGQSNSVLDNESSTKCDQVNVHHRGHVPTEGTSSDVTYWAPRSPSSSQLPAPSDRFYRALKPPEVDIEDLADWSTITFFTSLYLKYNHALSPIVHKPSFAHDLATRRDKRDRQFRSLLLGLVTYTIGQSPITRMDSDYTRRELEIIQDRCHRASVLLHDTTYREASLSTIGSLIYAYFYCQCNSDFTRASIFLASACELAQIMKLDETHLSTDLSQDFKEQELRKRVYWYLYAIDVTSACSGLPVHLSPSNYRTATPLEIDDEFITTQGSFPQPPEKLSTMTAFIAMVKLHIITGDALVRRRIPQRMSSHIVLSDHDAALQWVSAAETSIDNILSSLPYQLAPVQLWKYDSAEEERSLYGMQRANILITALAAKFVLFDYLQDLLPNDTITLQRRDEVARAGVQTITSIPQEDLASNGESMRNKVFRILLALMSRSVSEGVWGRTLQEWWDLYLNIQFVSIASADLATVIPSRDGTPAF